MGPLFFSRQLSSADMHAIAMESTWQWALWNLPFSGSAGLIAADLDELSEREARSLTRDYIDQLRGTIGPQVDVIAPARGCPPQIMAWALSALGSAEGRTLATIAGKPASVGGIDLEATAARFFRALFTCATKQYGVPPKGARVAILGFDSLSRRIALELVRAGARIVGVADRSGAISDANGLNIAALVSHVDREAMVYGYPDASATTLDDLLHRECDALIVSGAEPLLQHTSARVVFEAGGEVQCTLSRSVVVPSLLANFGLNFAAFCEWRKNSCGGFSDVDGLRGLPVHVRNTWREVHDYAQKRTLDLHHAAVALAISRLADAMRMK